MLPSGCSRPQALLQDWLHHLPPGDCLLLSCCPRRVLCAWHLFPVGASCLALHLLQCLILLGCWFADPCCTTDHLGRLTGALHRACWEWCDCIHNSCPTAGVQACVSATLGRNYSQIELQVSNPAIISLSLKGQLADPTFTRWHLEWKWLRSIQLKTEPKSPYNPGWVILSMW